MHLDSPRPAHHVLQPAVSRTPLLFDLPMVGNHGFAGMLDGRSIRIYRNVDFQIQNAFITRTEQRHGAMRRNFGNRFGELKIIAILGTFLFFAGNQL